MKPEPAALSAMRVVWIGADSRAWIGMEFLQRDSSEVRLETAIDAEEAMDLLENRPADLVLFEADREDGEPEWPSFARWVRTKEHLASCLLIYISGEPPGRSGAVPEADGILHHPIERVDLARYRRIVQRIRDRGIRYPSSASEAASPGVASGRPGDEFVALFESILDLGLPGAKKRGEWIAANALVMAERFEIPERLLEDLILVARFHEIGRLLEAGRAGGTSHRPATGGVHTYVLATRSLFQRIPGFEGAAKIAEALFENWDGSGQPSHLQRGEIPLRSRVLRILMDYRALAETGAGTDCEIVEKLEQHAGTRYDRMTVVFLKELLTEPVDHRESGWGCLVHVSELKPGMVLAEDLFTDSGIKLLARGTTLGPATIDIIMRRDAIDPILQGITICRTGS